MMANQGMVGAMMSKPPGSRTRAGLATSHAGMHCAVCGGGRKMEWSPRHGT